MRRTLLILAVVAAACGDAAGTPTAPISDGDEVIVIRASTDLAVGTERLLLALARPDGSRLGSPDLDVSVVVWPESDPTRRQEVAGTWIWAIPDRSGLYRATLEFDEPGVWIAEVVPDEGPIPAGVPLLIQERSNTPAIGTAAPASASPTAVDEEGIALITSDVDPDPRLYELSVAQAVSSGRPSVIAFATPQFCQTAICGPTLEVVKTLIPRYPNVNFIHVEVFDLAASPVDPGSIDELVLAEAVVEWGLTSEPWVFVVDADGRVSGRFEGVVDAGEIEALIG